MGLGLIRHVGYGCFGFRVKTEFSVTRIWLFLVWATTMLVVIYVTQLEFSVN